MSPSNNCKHLQPVSSLPSLNAGSYSLWLFPPPRDIFFSITQTRLQTELLSTPATPRFTHVHVSPGSVSILSRLMVVGHRAAAVERPRL